MIAGIIDSQLAVIYFQSFDKLLFCHAEQIKLLRMLITIQNNITVIMRY